MWSWSLTVSLKFGKSSGSAAHIYFLLPCGSICGFGRSIFLNQDRIPPLNHNTDPWRDCYYRCDNWWCSLCFCQSSGVIISGLMFAISSRISFSWFLSHVRNTKTASSPLHVNGPKVCPSLLTAMYENPHGSCFSVFIVKLCSLLHSQVSIFLSTHSKSA